MNTLDQAFWQVFHAVDATLDGDALLASRQSAEPDGVVELELKAPPHAMSILRREAERRRLDYPALIAELSEERAKDLPSWWLAIARNRAVGVLARASRQATELEL
jgi:hypothetical protein